MKGKGEQRALPSLASLCRVGAGEVRPPPPELWFPFLVSPLTPAASTDASTKDLT